MSGLTEQEGWEDVSYPIIVHGDAGTYTRKSQSSILCVSIKSCLSETFKSNVLPSFALPKDVRSYEAGVDTAHTCWEALVVQLNGLYDGVRPRVDSCATREGARGQPRWLARLAWTRQPPD